MRPYLLSLAATRTRLILLIRGNQSPRGDGPGGSSYFQLYLYLLLCRRMRPEGRSRHSLACVNMSKIDARRRVDGIVATAAAPEWRITDSNR